MTRALFAVLFAAMLTVAAASSPPTLGVQGEAFTVNGSPRFLVFISYFDATRRAASGGVDQDFAYLQGKVHGVRIFPNWWSDSCALRSGADTLIDVDGRIRAESWRQLRAVLDSAAAHGLIVDLSMTRDTVTDNGTPARTLTFEAFAGAMATLVGGGDYLKGRDPHVLIDVQNEWPRFAEAEEVEALLVRLRAADPRRVLAASSSGGAYELVGQALPNMVAAYHEPRAEDWFTAAAAKRVVAGVRGRLKGTVQPVYLQEPTPSSPRCSDNDHDADATHFLDAMKHARGAGAAAWTFHTRLGFGLREQSLTGKLEDPANASQKAVLEQLLE